MEERCLLCCENTETIVAYLQTLSLNELVPFTEQIFCTLSSAEQISYTINQFCSAYDDHDGRIRFFIALVESGIIEAVNVPFSFMRNPEMVDFIRSPVFDFYVPAAKSAESVVAALTDEILEVFSTLTVKNPRWIHVSEEREKASPAIAAVGDAIELLVDVSGYPEGAPVVFDVFDASSDPAMRIETVRGKTSGGTAKVSWKVNDPNKIGAELKLHFEGSARSKSSGIAPIDVRTMYKVEVRDEEKKPLEGIKVEFNVSGTKTVVTTDAMGLATHPADNPAIEAEVRILWDDAQSSESVIPPSLNKDDLKGTINIKCVLLETDEIIADTECTLKSEGKEFSGTTDDNGYVSWSDITAGNYFISASVNGKTYTAMAIWYKNDKTAHTIKLKPS